MCLGESRVGLLEVVTLPGEVEGRAREWRRCFEV